MNALPARLLPRLLALAILALLIGLLWTVIARPLLETLDDDSLARSAKLIAGYERAAAERPAVEAKLRELRTQDASLAGLLEGATTAVAAANLQSEVKKVIEDCHGEIRSAQNLATSTVDSFERIEIRYDLSAPMSALETLLYGIETHQPYLFLDAIDISTAESWSPDTAGASDPKLAIRLSIGGYRRAGAS